MMNNVTAKMTKRPYIDCPLWAAIAAKYHGIRIAINFGGVLIELDSIERILATSRVRFYIHPESYDKLEPHVGDYVETWDDIDKHPLYWKVRLEDEPESIKPFEIVIYRRNNIPFPPIQWEELE